MFRDLGESFKEAMRRTLGVDEFTAAQIVAAHKNEGLLNAWGWGPLGQMRLVNSETLPERVHQYAAQGATRMSVTVFDEKMIQGESGERVSRTIMAARYNIWPNN